MATKLTKRDVLNKIIAVCANDEAIVAYAKHEIELIDAKNEKRKAAPKKPTKAQLEAEALKPQVYAALGDEPKSAKDIGDALGVAFQKITPILRALVADGKAEIVLVKGKNLYKSV
jgi:predicted Rossmann fold nucleotide-binding protein DprA/Smf involved in DNA uptake